MPCWKPAWRRRATACCCRKASPGCCRLRVDGEGRTRTIAVRTPKARVMEIAEPRRSAPGRMPWRGLPLGALPPALMDGGRRWWLAELADEAALRAATPNWDAIAALAERTESMGLCVFARSADPVLLLRGARLRRRAGTVRGRRLRRRQCDAGRLAGLTATPCPARDGRYRISQGREVGHDAIIDLHVDARWRSLVGRPRLRRRDAATIDWSAHD